MKTNLTPGYIPATFSLAKCSRAVGPGSKPTADKLADHTTYVTFLGSAVASACMIDRDSPRPRLFPVIQPSEKLSCIVHIGVRIEHVPHGHKFPVVPVVIDLHASDIDQLFAFGVGLLKPRYRFCKTCRIDARTFNVHGIGIQLAFAAGLIQRHRIQDSQWH